MPRHNFEALLLRVVDFGESDRIVHLLTPESGRLTAIAKGARRSVKRFPGTLDLFNHLKIQVYRSRPGRMAHLQQARLVSPFVALRENPRRFALACYLLELFDRLSPEGGSPRESEDLFRFALRVFTALECAEPDARLRVLLELRTLDALGLRPELSQCVRCGAPPESPPRLPGFHLPDGGLVCAACSPPGESLIRVHLGTLRALETVLRLDLDRLDRLSLGPAALAEATELVVRFARFHVGIELRSESFLDETLGRPSAPGG